MNLKSFLGKRPSEINNLSSFAVIEEVYEDIDEDEEQKYSISSHDKTFQMSINDEGIIDTIFIFADKTDDLIDGIKSNWKVSDLINVFGKPNSEKEEKSVFMGIEIGPWVKYEFEKYSLHVQYSYDQDSIEMVTIMLPGI